MEPVSRLLLELVRDAQHAGRIDVDDTHRAAALVQQTVMYSWFGNRLIQSPRQRLGAEETWEFCLHGSARARTASRGGSRLIRPAGQTRSRSSIRIALPRRILYRWSSVSVAAIRSTSSRTNGQVVSVCG